MPDPTSLTDAEQQESWRHLEPRLRNEGFGVGEYAELLGLPSDSNTPDLVEALLGRIKELRKQVEAGRECAKALVAAQSCCDALKRAGEVGLIANLYIGGKKYGH